MTMCILQKFSFLHTEGIPHDGTAKKETVVIAVPLTVLVYLLATVGLVFTLFCFGFIFYFRKSK